MHLVRNTLIAAALASLIGGGYLYAQPAGGPSADDEDDIAVPMEGTASLTPREMTQKSDELIEEMKGTLRRVLTLQSAARKTKDIIKLNCVNDKLLQVKQLLNISEASRNNMTEAIASNDEGGRYHQFSQVTVASDKTRTLRDEAEACIGEELTFVGPTQIEVDKPDVVDDPTKDDPFDFSGNSVEIERAAYASPFGAD
ncbi:MAG TPA: hypothetical protein VML75_17515 [Kofleriaceae bacterium]|nr:hypothetical protein [Kofleriaceae bacterium]